MARRKKTFPLPFIIVTILIVIICVCFIIFEFFFGSSTEEADKNDMFGITQADDAVIIIDDEQADFFGKYIGGDYYISYEDVWNYINCGFYVEKSSDTLYMALPSETLSWPVGDPDGYLLKDSGGAYYISAECVGKYTNISVETYDEPHRIVIRTQWEGLEYVTVEQDTQMRTDSSEKSKIIKEYVRGDKVVCIRTDGSWTFAASQDGFTGYIKTKCLSEEYTPVTYETDSSLDFGSVVIDGTVKMAWDYIGGYEESSYLDDVMKGVSGLNVISPTWFAIDDTSGSVTSYADREYVEKAHSKYGLLVWALVSGYSKEDSTTGEVLESYESRQRCISQILENALTCGIDGINIDFEDISEECSPAYIEFLRELTTAAHEHNLIVSVDNYVPGYSAQYRRDAQNEIVDYIIMMGYDEHTANTSEYGSVASITYVEDGVKATLDEVDPDKLILGIPFYSRGWTVPFGSAFFETETLFMSAQQDFIDAHGIELEWDASAGQYTGSSEGEDCRYYIWVEDGESIAEKLSLVGKYNLAGASAWRLGMETEDIWEIWQKYL